MKYFLSFDVGTTAMKCILFNQDFNNIYSVGREYSLNVDNGHFAEADAEMYYNVFLECIGDLFKTTNISGDDISSLTFTTQGETLIPVDKNGVALSPAVVWLDNRADAEAKEIKQAISLNDIYSTTGLCDIDGALPAAKISWFYNNKPDIHKNTYKFLLLEDYLIYKLTGKFVSEKSLQSSTGWYDIFNDCLYNKMLNVCNIDKSKLPDILDCGEKVASICDKKALSLGMSDKTVVTTGAMDQIASAIGAGNIKEGILTETTGTALAVGVTVNNPETNIEKPVTVYKHYNDKYIYMPFSATAGIVLKWYRDNITPYINDEAKKLNVSSYSLLDKKAEGSPAGSNGVITMPDFTNGGGFLGLTLSTNVSDLTRSVMEGITYTLKQMIECIEEKGVAISSVFSLGGGSYSKIWRQIKADICNKRIISLKNAQTTALGAAILGSVATGTYKSVEDAAKIASSVDEVINPNTHNLEVYDKSYKKFIQYTNAVSKTN